MRTQHTQRRRKEDQQTLAEPGRHSYDAQTSQEDGKENHEHDKTLDVMNLDLSGIPLTLNMGNPLTRDPSLIL